VSAFAAAVMVIAVTAPVMLIFLAAVLEAITA
jgi:hypothetical protein